MSHFRNLALILCVLAATTASADPLRARDTAEVRSKGSWSMGIFNALIYAPRDGFEIDVNPLIFLVAPNVIARVAHVAGGPGAWRVAGEYGLSVPSGGFHLTKPFGLQGDLVPSCKVSADNPSLIGWCQAPGWAIVPRAGLVLSKGNGDDSKPDRSIFTAKADIAVGIVLAGERGTPLDAIPAIDLWTAPVYNKYRARIGVAYDLLLTDWLRTRIEANLYRVGDAPDVPRSPYTFSAHLGLDLAVGSASRFTLGAMYWNSDQHAIELGKNAAGKADYVPVRSNDFFPTIDFIWSN